MNNPPLVDKDGRLRPLSVVQPALTVAQLRGLLTGAPDEAVVTLQGDDGYAPLTAVAIGRVRYADGAETPDDVWEVTLS